MPFRGHRTMLLSATSWKASRPLVKIRLRPPCACPASPAAGRNPVREALASGEAALRLLYSDDHAREIQFLVAQASARGIQAQQVGRPILDRVSSGGNHQGIALELPDRAQASLADSLDLA